MPNKLPQLLSNDVHLFYLSMVFAIWVLWDQVQNFCTPVENINAPILTLYEDPYMELVSKIYD